MLNAISVKKALKKINSSWFLPYKPEASLDINYEQEEHKICLLLDALMRDYPVGLITLFKTKTPHYRFPLDYANYENSECEQVKGCHFVVWEGQQILQSLYCCMYTFNNKVLCYNLQHDMKGDVDKRRLTGFSFQKKDKILPWYCLNIPSLIGKSYREMERFSENFHKQNAKRNFHFRVTDNLRKIREVFFNEERRNLNYFVTYDFYDTVESLFRRNFCVGQDSDISCHIGDV